MQPDSWEADGQVTVGGLPCRVTGANGSGINCTVGPSPAGWQDVCVSLPGLGRDAGNAAIARVFQVTSVSPPNASLAGGRLPRSVQFWLQALACGVRARRVDAHGFTAS